jgi:hypothetical protein
MSDYTNYINTIGYDHSGDIEADCDGAYTDRDWLRSDIRT